MVRESVRRSRGDRPTNVIVWRRQESERSVSSVRVTVRELVDGPICPPQALFVFSQRFENAVITSRISFQDFMSPSPHILFLMVGKAPTGAFRRNNRNLTSSPWIVIPTFCPFDNFNNDISVKRKFFLDAWSIPKELDTFQG